MNEYIYIYIYIYIGSSDTACTWVDLHTAPKDLSEMSAVSNCVNTVFANELQCELRSSDEDWSSHCNSFANTTFISITSHYWRSPAVPDSSCKTSSEQCVSLWSYLIPLSGSLPGHHFRPWRCWGAD